VLAFTRHDEASGFLVTANFRDRPVEVELDLSGIADPASPDPIRRRAVALEAWGATLERLYPRND
jgi:hypothetical protein